MHLCIELLSDLCPGNGTSYGSLIDSDVCYDECGIPYIPSRRIKGCLRDAACEILDWNGDDAWSNTIDQLFGISNKSQGRLFISDAFPEGCDMLEDAVHTDTDGVQPHAQEIIKCFSYMRAQTAVDRKTGCAKRNSLRFMRVLGKGQKFYSDITLPEEYIGALQKCCKALRHIGMNRTRGIGSVKVTITKTKQSIEIRSTNNWSLNGAEAVSLLLYAVSPVMASEVNASQTGLYLPGGSIAGFFSAKYIEKYKPQHPQDDPDFRRIFIEGGVRFSNFYISNQDGQVCFPAPASFGKIKDSDTYIDRAGDKEQDKQLSSIDGKFMSFVKGDFHTVSIAEPETEAFYHHSRSGVDEGAVIKDFFQFSCLSKGQYFSGTISGRPELMKIIISMLLNCEIVQIGKSKTAQYSALRVMECKEKPRCDTFAFGKKFVVLLTSDMVLFDSTTGYATTEVETLVKTLSEKTGTSLKESKSFIHHTVVSGYNTAWQMHRQQFQGFAGGTVLVLESEQPVRMPKCFSVGEMTGLGYGGVMMFEFENPAAAVTVLEQTPEQISHSNTEECRTSVILLKVMFGRAEDEIRVMAAKASKNANGINPTTVNTLLQMLRDCSSVGEFNDLIGRFKDKEKKDSVRRMICGTFKTVQEFQADLLSRAPAYQQFLARKDGAQKPAFADRLCRLYFEAYLTGIKYTLRKDDESEQDL